MGVNNTQKQTVARNAARRQLVSLVLSMGKWRHAFSEYQVKLMVAEALNYCVLMQSLRIKGYLITSSKVYLSVHMDPDILHRVLMLFFERIRRELNSYLAIQKGPAAAFSAEESSWLHDESYTLLFTTRHLKNEYLIAYLTGKKMDQTCYNASLEAVKAVAPGNDFCSLKDYAGGTSAVLLDINR